MASIEQRVERVEVHVDAHHQLLTDLRSGLRQFQQEVSDRFAQIDARFAQVDARFAQVDVRFGQVDARFGQIDARFGQIDARFGQIDARLLSIDQKVDAVRHEMALQFRWLVGILLTGMLTIAAAILAG